MNQMASMTLVTSTVVVALLHSLLSCACVFTFHFSLSLPASRSVNWSEDVCITHSKTIHETMSWVSEFLFLSLSLSPCAATVKRMCHTLESRWNEMETREEAKNLLCPLKEGKMIRQAHRVTSLLCLMRFFILSSSCYLPHTLTQAHWEYIFWRLTWQTVTSSVQLWEENCSS